LDGAAVLMALAIPSFPYKVLIVAHSRGIINFKTLESLINYLAINCRGAAGRVIVP
jgi:hypothetical protein